jgi:hypothetical protein
MGIPSLGMNPPSLILDHSTHIQSAAPIQSQLFCRCIFMIKGFASSRQGALIALEEIYNEVIIFYHGLYHWDVSLFGYSSAYIGFDLARGSLYISRR